MAIPDYQSLMLPVLRFAAKGATSVKAAEQALASELALTEADRVGLLPSGKQRNLHNRIHWAKFYLQKAGLLASPNRGWFAITPDGEAALATAPAKIDNAFLKRFPVFVSFLSGQSMAQGGHEPLPANAGVATPEELIGQAYQSLDLALRAELIERILQKEPDFSSS